MEEAKGPVKHIVLAKFKDDASPDKIEEIIKAFANLVNLIEPMKAFHWGKDVSIENRQKGFTHVFESTFESKEAVAEYLIHPVHREFGKSFLESLDDILVVDYTPTSV